MHQCSLVVSGLDPSLSGNARTLTTASERMSLVAFTVSSVDVSASWRLLRSPAWWHRPRPRIQRVGLSYRGCWCMGNRAQDICVCPCNISVIRMNHMATSTARFSWRCSALYEPAEQLRGKCIAFTSIAFRSREILFCQSSSDARNPSNAAAPDTLSTWYTRTSVTRSAASVISAPA